nr:hypothetical protein BaRGS_015744 [Batillaria attramentaria]
MCPLCPMIFVSHEELGRHVLIHAKVRRKDVVKVKAYSSSGTASSAGGIARCKSSAVKIGSDDDPETDDD